MSLLFGGWGGGGGLEVLKCFVRGDRNFFYLLCVCGRGVRFSTSPSVKKITDPLLLINDWSLYQKVPRVTTSLICFKIFLVTFPCRLTENTNAE